MNYATERLLAAAKASLAAWEDAGQYIGQRYPDMMEELESALSYFDAHGAKEPALRVLVHLDGGIVQGIIADRPGVHAVVVDYDTEGADAAELYDIPQDDGSTAEAFRSDWGEVESDQTFIAAALAAPSVEADEGLLTDA